MRALLLKALFVTVLAAGPASVAYARHHQEGGIATDIAVAMFVLYLISAAKLRSATINGAIVAFLAGLIVSNSIPGIQLWVLIAGVVVGAIGGLLASKMWPPASRLESLPNRHRAG